MTRVSSAATLQSSEFGYDRAERSREAPVIAVFDFMGFACLFFPVDGRFTAGLVWLSATTPEDFS
jgi:hypothetical protein